MVLLTLMVAAAPAALLLTYFYLRDRFEREPIRYIAAAYCLGVLSMLAARTLAIMGETLVGVEWLALGGEPARLFDAFILSAFIEELAKWCLLLAIIYRWREFDEPLDGLVYGVALSLGFATIENFYYLTRLGLGVAWQRALFAVPAHALFGGAMGYYAARAKFARPARPTFHKGLALAVPCAFHGGYDYSLLHHLDWKIWLVVTLLSVAFWGFVLRRVYRAQRASPYRPKTMPPPPSFR